MATNGEIFSALLRALDVLDDPHIAQRVDADAVRLVRSLESRREHDGFSAAEQRAINAILDAD